MKKSFLFLALFAAFAMIFASCSKSSSNSGGGVNYGTITIGDQSFTISHSGYTVSYDDDIEANIVGIALATADDQKDCHSISILLDSSYRTVCNHNIRNS